MFTLILPTGLISKQHPLEIYVYDGHYTDSLQRGIANRYSPNGIVGKSHLSTEYPIVGHDHLLNIDIGKPPTPLTSRKFAPSILSKLYSWDMLGINHTVYQQPVHHT